MGVAEAVFAVGWKLPTLTAILLVIALTAIVLLEEH